MGSMLTLPCVPQSPELEADRSGSRPEHKVQCGKEVTCLWKCDAHYPQAFQHSSCWQSDLRTRCTFVVVLERRALHAAVYDRARDRVGHQSERCDRGPCSD